MPLVIIRKEECKRVKNGWLLRHRMDVDHFESMSAGEKPPYGAYLTAHMKDTTVYFTTFASDTVLTDWLCRPAFQGLTWIHDNVAREI
jgi:hypothetical protein